MTMISKAAMGIAVGIAGIFVGYCLYFDKKRRSDPDFKKKLRERRRAMKQARQPNSKLPDMNDYEIVQKFFLREVQLGEELLSLGNLEDGVEHLANAVAVCGQPSHLLQVLQKTLPSEVFCLLVQRMPTVTQQVTSQSAMAEEDVE